MISDYFQIPYERLAHFIKFTFCISCHSHLEGSFSRLLHDSHTVSPSFSWPNSSTSVFAIHFLWWHSSCIFRKEYDCLFSVYMWRRAPHARISWGAIFCLWGTSSLPTLLLRIGWLVLSCSSSTRNHPISSQSKPLTGTTWRIELQL